MSDERIAIRLLHQHLMERETGFQCRLSLNEPPDLIVTWASGVQWGVEVTRTYHQVETFGGGRLVASEQTVSALTKFAEEVGENTKDVRKRSYIIFLEGPGPFSSWKMPASKKKWKKDTLQAIWQHIVSEKNCFLRVPGVKLQPSEPGKCWRIYVSGGGGPSEIGSANVRMIRCALEKKTKDLPRWNGHFSERWLLLLNCYPLAEDPPQVKNMGIIYESAEKVAHRG